MNELTAALASADEEERAELLGHIATDGEEAGFSEAAVEEARQTI
jgi:hypothetical protein